MFERFVEWERHSLVHLQLAVCAALTPAQYQSQPPEVVTVLHLEFYSNLLTFRPIEPPRAVRTSNLASVVGQRRNGTVLRLRPSRRPG